ncbi:MAG: hypothetical protein HFF11_08160 [Angelakisella sp.]|nr:hypothetical protein [Angelakisella sp.]
MKELESLHTLARTEEGEVLWVTYKLLEEDGRYGVLCYFEGLGEERGIRLGDLCGSRAIGEALLSRLAGGQVLPAHMADLIWEVV